jgi:glycosyltransferase involved in cell wall biosynthesis
VSGVKVGVDATSWANRRGFGRFARNAVRRLVELDPETTYVLYVDGDTAAQWELPAGATKRQVALRRASSEAASAESNRGVGDILRLTRAVGADRPAAFLFPSLYTYFPVFRVPTVVGLHDTTAVEFPELTLRSFRARTLWRAKQRLALSNAARLFTVSEASRAGLAARLGLAPERLPVVPEAPDPVFHPRSPQEWAPELEGLGLAPGERPFVYAGGISPHKNIETLLAAYAELRGREQAAPRLVIVGDLETEVYVSAASSVRAAVGRLGLEDAVLLPGFVSDEALGSLYSAATALVIPSLGEGFGLPAVEAAACGAPTILSDLPAHRESLGDAALYFPPTDVRALTEALGRVANDDGLRAEMSERGRQAASRMSWDDAARKLRELIGEAAAG